MNLVLSPKWFICQNWDFDTCTDFHLWMLVPQGKWEHLQHKVKVNTKFEKYANLLIHRLVIRNGFHIYRYILVTIRWVTMFYTWSDVYKSSTFIQLYNSLVYPFIFIYIAKVGQRKEHKTCTFKFSYTPKLWGKNVRFNIKSIAIIWKND